MSELVVIETLDPVVIYSGGLDDVLAQLAKELRADLPDISTDEGRKTIASRAYKAARCKTRLDELGKDLGEDAKKKLDAINADRKKARDFLDNLKEEIRKPLTEWEQKEETRIKTHEFNIAELEAIGVIPSYATSAEIDSAMERLNAMRQAHQWEEFCFRADTVSNTVSSSLKSAFEQAKKREAEAAELEKLRAEKAQRDAEEEVRRRLEHEKRLMEVAAETARKAAEEKAANDARLAADEAERVLKAQKSAAAAALERAEAAEQMAEAAKQQAIRDQEAAVQAERDRAAQVAKAEADAAAAREANQKHKAKINNEVMAALVTIATDAQSTDNGDIVKAIVIAIAQGKIPHVKINY